MKTVHFSVLLFMALLLLGSCSTGKDFSKRKYRPGIFTDRPGKTEPAAIHEAFSEMNSIREETADTNSNEIHTAPAALSGSSLAPIQKPVPVAGSIQPGVPEIQAKARQKIPPPGFDPEEATEQIKINRMFWLSFAAVFLFFLGILALLMLSIAIVGIIIWAIALACSLSGYVTALQVRKMHLTGDQYTGKGKVVFSYVIGILGIILGCIGVLIGSLLVAIILS